MQEQGYLQSDSKKRILQEAARLFATKGYSAVGVREIAEAANVNVSMISYYYSGKFGIFKEIVKLYFDEIMSILNRPELNSLSFEEKVKQITNDIVRLISEKPILCKAAINMLPHDLPEISEYKKMVDKFHIDYVKRFTEVLELDNLSNEHQAIVTPALMSVIYSIFVFSPFFEKIWNLHLDERFYDSYSKVISNIILFGLPKTIEMLKS